MRRTSILPERLAAAAVMSPVAAGYRTLYMDGVHGDSGAEPVDRRDAGPPTVDASPARAHRGSPAPRRGRCALKRHRHRGPAAAGDGCRAARSLDRPVATVGPSSPRKRAGRAGGVYQGCSDPEWGQLTGVDTAAENW